MMTRAYLRYALMATSLGFWLLCVSIGGVWGGLEVGVNCLFKLFGVSIWFPLVYVEVLGLFILVTSISFVAALGRGLAAEAPRGCSVSALLLPPLLPLLMLAFIPPATEKLRSLLQYPWARPFDLLPLLAIALLYAGFLLAFRFHSHARKRAEGRDGEERPADDGTSASSPSSMKNGTRTSTRWKSSSCAARRPPLPCWNNARWGQPVMCPLPQAERRAGLRPALVSGQVVPGRRCPPAGRGRRAAYGRGRTRRQLSAQPPPLHGELPPAQRRKPRLPGLAARPRRPRPHPPGGLSALGQ